MGVSEKMNPVAKLPIKVCTMDGKTYKINATKDWNVRMLKIEFEKWHGGDATKCSLYYRVKKLQDSNTLKDYNIGAGKRRFQLAYAWLQPFICKANLSNF